MQLEQFICHLSPCINKDWLLNNDEGFNIKNLEFAHSKMVMEQQTNSYCFHAAKTLFDEAGTGQNFMIINQVQSFIQGFLISISID